VPVEAGIYRLNRVKEGTSVTVDCSARDERQLPQTFVDYDAAPREYFLSAVNTMLDVHTRVSDLYSTPHNQIAEQLRLTIETVKERQESELLNNKEYGLLTNVAPEAPVSWAESARLNPGPFEFHGDQSHVLAWMAKRGMLFCRLGSRIGMDFQRLRGNVFLIPDGSEWFLVDEQMLLGLTEEMNAVLVDPLKTTIVQDYRCMTTWVLRKRRG